MPETKNYRLASPLVDRENPFATIEEKPAQQFTNRIFDILRIDKEQKERIVAVTL